MKRVVVFSFMAMVIIGSCAAQNTTNDAQRIVGTWVSENRSDIITVVFNANGTGTWNGNDFFYGISAGGYIYITSQGGNPGLFISPDGRRWIFGGTVFQKR